MRLTRNRELKQSDSVSVLPATKSVQTKSMFPCPVSKSELSAANVFSHHESSLNVKNCLLLLLHPTSPISRSRDHLLRRLAKPTPRIHRLRLCALLLPPNPTTASLLLQRLVEKPKRNSLHHFYPVTANPSSSQRRWEVQFGMSRVQERS